MNIINESYSKRIESLITPAELIKQYPASKKIKNNVTSFRQRIKKILYGKDRRLLVIIGPCSIYDLDATMDYAKKLKSLRETYSVYLEIVMRTFFEKPRTVAGWKGLIYDPDLNGSYRINHGLTIARKLLLKINEIDIPTATEFLNITTEKFISDLISWGTIGARTTESQIHREMASALPCPIGFKNNTDGNVRVAIEAMLSSRSSHTFVSPDKNGKMSIYQTKGNPFSRIIMRGGNNKPNYYAEDIAMTCKLLHKLHLPEQIIVDFSHGNSQKQYRNQLDVCDAVCQQICRGSNKIIGIMAESFLIGGNQKVMANTPIIYGQSVTDPCLSLKETELILEKLAMSVKKRFSFP